MYNIIITVLLMASFFLCLISYSFGVKHGRIVKEGGIPNVNPYKAYKAVKADVQAQKQIDAFAEGINNIMSFGEPMKDERG